MKRFLALVLMFLLVACTAQETKTTPTSIKIGVALPLTGGWSPAGEAGQRGILIALDEINAQGGINGIPVEIVIEDTRSEPAQAVTAVQKLINMDKVPVIIGGMISGEAVPVAPIAQQAGIVLLSPIALTTPLETAGEWVFKLRESTGVHAETLLKEISKRGYKKLAIISQSYESCDDYLERMKTNYDKYGIQVIALEKYEGKDMDMRTQLSKLQKANPDAWFSCGLYQDVGLVVKQAKELGFNKPLFSMSGIESKKLFEIAGDAAEGAILTSTKWSCEHAQSFCDTYRKKYNAEPDYRSAFSYDAFKLVAEAIKRKGYSAEDIKQGLLSIQDYVGAGEKTSFDAEGNAQKEVVVKQVKGDKFVVIK